jgi:epoxyqueuosine reductase
MSILSFADLVKISREAGLTVVGASVAAPDPNAARHLKTWQEEGFAGEMKYMKRDAEKLTNPLQLLPEAKTVIQFAVGYGSQKAAHLRPGLGRVARYAWGLDYHEVLRNRLKMFVEKVRQELGDVRARVFSDAVPLTERAFGAKAGLGFVGKNTLLIIPGQGSLFFLADVITDLEISGLPDASIKGRCGECSNCLEACPTQAFVAPYRMDARRCISYLTIEKRGMLSTEEESWLGEWIFGCDICQEVCPFNHAPIKLGKKASLVEFEATQGAGPFLDLKQILSIREDSAFESRFKGTPLIRPGREGLLRNAAAVAGNTLWIEGVDSLVSVVLEEDSAAVRKSSINALKKISKAAGSKVRRNVQTKLENVREEAEEQVRLALINFFES